jgi:hypothetical protein
MRNYFQGWQAVFLITICALGFPVSGHSQQETVESTAASAISLTIRVKDHIVKTGLPVWVDVTEKNNSSQILSVGRENPVTMDQGGRSFIVDVWNDAGVRSTESTFYRKMLGHLTPAEKTNAEPRNYSGFTFLLKPGETITDRIDVSKLYDLSRPGIYRIQVQLPIESNTIRVTVTP